MTAEALAEVERAHAAFGKELPTLLAEHSGEWVAYVGGERMGVAATKLALYRLCRARGLSDDEVLIRCIEPQEDVVSLGSGVLGIE